MVIFHPSTIFLFQLRENALNLNAFTYKYVGTGRVNNTNLFPSIAFSTDSAQDWFWVRVS